MPYSLVFIGTFHDSRESHKHAHSRRVTFPAVSGSEKSDGQRPLEDMPCPVRHMTQHVYSSCHSDSRARSVRARQPTQYSHKVALSQCGSRACAQDMICVRFISKCCRSASGDVDMMEVMRHGGRARRERPCEVRTRWVRSAACRFGHGRVSWGADRRRTVPTTSDAARRSFSFDTGL